MAKTSGSHLEGLRDSGREKYARVECVGKHTRGNEQASSLYHFKECDILLLPREFLKHGTYHIKYNLKELSSPPEISKWL